MFSCISRIWHFIAAIWVPQTLQHTRDKRKLKMSGHGLVLIIIVSGIAGAIAIIVIVQRLRQNRDT